MRIAIVSHDHSEPDLIRELHEAFDNSGHGDTPVINHNATTLDGEQADLWVVDWSGHVAQASRPPARPTREGTAGLPPLLAVIGRGRVDDAVAAVAAGADDYIVRPLRRGELAMRAEALLRRAYPERHAADDGVRFGPYCFHTHRPYVTRNSVPVDLTQKEFELAFLLFRHLGRPLSRAFIQEEVWSREADLPSRTMDTHVSRVRNKLGLRPENGFRLAPVYSYGYRLEELP